MTRTQRSTTLTVLTIVATTAGLIVALITLDAFPFITKKASVEAHEKMEQRQERAREKIIKPITESIEKIQAQHEEDLKVRQETVKVMTELRRDMFWIRKDTRELKEEFE